MVYWVAKMSIHRWVLFIFGHVCKRVLTTNKVKSSFGFSLLLVYKWLIIYLIFWTVHRGVTLQ